MNERVRGFPAFPPSKRGRGRLARSWWGNAWLDALEDTSLDAEQLKKGLRYAHAGRVGPITVSPGRIAATVHEDGSGSAAMYQSRVFLGELGDVAWQRFTDRVAAKAGHIAALLEADMPRDLVHAAEDAGVPLLPGIGDLEPECDCSDWEYPCQHAAALCYQAAWLLDDDPFVLLLLRGRDKRELIETLSRQGTPAEQRAEQPRGTPAEQAYAATVAPLPPAQPVPTSTPVTERLPGAPGVDPDALAFLVEDTAARARELLAATEPPPVLDEWQDMVRIAATRQLPCADRGLARAVRAWEYGGQAGLEIHDTAWSPSRTELTNAHAALERMRMEEDGLPELTRWQNCWTATEFGWQLRYSTDGRWYPYRADDGEWWPAGPPERDPTAALGAVLDGSSGP